jgi:small subunit ribosomal protein S10
MSAEAEECRTLAAQKFEIRTHRRILDIENPSPKVIEALTNIDLPAGVNIDVKMM